MIIIKGYKLDTTDIQVIEAILSEIREKAEAKAKKIYAKLLAQEIELFVDDIALNVLPRPTNNSIYNLCVNELNNKISWATGNGVPTIYNLSVQAAVFTYSNATYIKLNIANGELSKAIKMLSQGEIFNLTNCNDKDNKKASEVWTEIMNIYSNGTNPLVKQLYPNKAISVEWSEISKYFHNPRDRIDLRVRYTLTSELLNMIGMRKEIPNYRLLPYLDEAMMMLDLPQIKEEASVRKQQAIEAIVNITEEMVMKNYADEVPSDK